MPAYLPMAARVAGRPWAQSPSTPGLHVLPDAWCGAGVRSLGALSDGGRGGEDPVGDALFIARRAGSCRSFGRQNLAHVCRLLLGTDGALAPISETRLLLAAIAALVLVPIARGVLRWSLQRIAAAERWAVGQRKRRQCAARGARCEGERGNVTPLDLDSRTADHRTLHLVIGASRVALQSAELRCVLTRR